MAIAVFRRGMGVGPELPSQGMSRGSGAERRTA
jgi:hypothetical protein